MDPDPDPRVPKSYGSYGSGTLPLAALGAYIEHLCHLQARDLRRARLERDHRRGEDELMTDQVAADQQVKIICFYMARERIANEQMFPKFCILLCVLGTS